MASQNVVSIGLRDLLDAGLHFGHQTKRWNPKMKPYIFDKRNGIHIIDLTKTIKQLEEAGRFLRETTLAGKRILFVSTKRQTREAVREAAESCQQFHVTHRWLGGTMTNSPTIRRSVRRMRQIEAIARNNKGQLSAHKKEAANLRRELDKLQRNLSGIADMDNLPGALVVVDVCREAIAVAEANTLGIPVVAITDTNADPDPVDYIIPGNDDAIRAVKLVVDALAEVIRKADEEHRRLEAEKIRQKEAERAAAQARRQAAGKAKDQAAGEAGAKATPKLTSESRKQAAQKAREAMSDRIAAAGKAAKAAAEPAPAAGQAEESVVAAQEPGPEDGAATAEQTSAPADADSKSENS